jgi:DNA-binding LacI/PurR family transcriptional regulator
MTTIHDVARAAGVSISTVSYALSGKRSIAETTRRRVTDAASRLGYQPHAGARMMAGTRTQIFAVTAPLRHDTYAPAHMAFVLAVATAARRHDYDILLLTEDEATKGLSRVASSRLVDGVIVLDVSARDERVDLVRSLGLPTVLVGIPDDTTGLACIDLDFEAAVRMAVDRLAALGHRRIAHIGHPEEIYERGSNFPLRVRAEFGRYTDDIGVDGVFVTSETDGASVRATVKALLDADEPPTALLLHAQESVQAAALGYLAERGVSVPNDLSVISVGSTFDTSRFEPALDVIPLVATATCDVAVDLLIDSLPFPPSPSVHYVAPEYRSFGSVSPPPSS